jgi:DNA-binding NarL/FixJ family response regulator
VLSLIVFGLSDTEIAEQVVVGEGTVRSHINDFLSKRDARDRTQAVTYAFQNGLT